MFAPGKEEQATATWAALARTSDPEEPPVLRTGLAVPAGSSPPRAESVLDRRRTSGRPTEAPPYPQGRRPNALRIRLQVNQVKAAGPGASLAEPRCLARFTKKLSLLCARSSAGGRIELLRLETQCGFLRRSLQIEENAGSGPRVRGMDRRPPFADRAFAVAGREADPQERLVPDLGIRRDLEKAPRGAARLVQITARLRQRARQAEKCNGIAGLLLQRTAQQRHRLGRAARRQERGAVLGGGRKIGDDEGVARHGLLDGDGRRSGVHVGQDHGPAPLPRPTLAMPVLEGVSQLRSARNEEQLEGPLVIDGSGRN